MRITKLELYNFGPYKGKFDLTFEKTNKNIEIITGRNGSGKTSIFNAIQWCLYGYEPSPMDPKPKTPTRNDAWFNLYGTNKENQIPPDPNMYVNLWLEETIDSKKDVYLIKRSVKPRIIEETAVTDPQLIDFELVVEENGRKIDNPVEKIDSLIPVSASQFFMFHGENLRPISQKHMDHTKKAIELILEAELFRQGLKDLRDVNRTISKEYDEELKNVDNLKGVISSKETKIEELEKQKEELEKLNEILDESDKRLKNIEIELTSYESTKTLMQNIDDGKRQLEQIKDDIKKLMVRRDSLIAQLPALVTLPVLNKIMELKEETHNKNEKIKKNINEIRGKIELIDQISQLPLCFCGNKITNIEKNLLSQQKIEFVGKLDELKDKIIEEDPNYYSIKDIVTFINSRNLDFETYQKDLNTLYLRRDETESDKKRIEKLLSGINKEEIMKLNIERNKKYTELGELKQKIANKNVDISETKKIIDRFTKLITQRERSQSISSSLSDQYDLTFRIIESYNYILDNLIKVRKELLMKKTTEYFLKLTNNPTEYKKIDVDETYNLSVVDSTGSSRKREKLSTGERGVVALSFILGLKSASEKNAPLFLDTFFSHLDESHYTNIIQEFPTFADQIILILTDLEFKTLRERAPESFFNAVNNVWMTKRIKEEERSEIRNSRGVYDE